MSLGKHFINQVADPIQRAMRISLYHEASMRLMPEDKVLYRQGAPEAFPKVLLVAGGGSGHEPAYAGYLGQGMIDIAIAGHVFASPSASQILAGLLAMDSSAGYLMIVKNYTGDKLNFGLAAEKAKAEYGRNVGVVFVGEDVSVEGNSLVGQRGLAGVVLVLKVAGAKATKGVVLEEVMRVAQKAANRMATAAASLDRCSVPGRENQESLPFGEVEYGMGIHNEPGVRREVLASLEESIEKVINILLAERTNGWNMAANMDLALMINNLGGLSQLELDVIADEVLSQLQKRGLNIKKLMVGSFLTCLDAPGFSVTLLELDIEIEELLDAPTSAPAWPHTIWKTDVVRSQCVRLPAMKDHSGVLHERVEDYVASDSSRYDLVAIDIGVVAEVVDAIEKSTVEDEPLITKYDTIAGDGDCGETLLNGVNALVRLFNGYHGPKMTLYEIFRLAATAAERGMGGTSGAIYAIFLNAVSTSLAKSSDSSTSKSVPELLKQALLEGLQDLYKYTLARRGHRTLMDALIPFVETLQESSLQEAYAKARQGAELTKNMTATLGRASYVSKTVFAEQLVSDPGALGVVSIIKGICNGLGISV